MTYWILKIVLTPILYVVYRIRVEGKEHLPRHGAVILAANHRSFLDSIFIPLLVRRRVTFVAKAEYFDDPRTAWFFRAVGQIPIRREGGSASDGALAAATEVLEQRRRLRDLPGGHPHPRRLPAQGQDRCRPARARDRRADRARRADRERRVPADRRQAAAPVQAGDDPVRSADLDGPLRRARARPPGAAPDHRRADVRALRALGLRVPGHLRQQVRRARWPRLPRADGRGRELAS